MLSLMTITKRSLVGRVSLSLLVAGMVFGLLEGVARWRGWGGYAPVIREIGRVNGRLLVETDWRGSLTYFLASRTGLGSGYQQSFFVPKTGDTVRIVLAGESAIKGFPQPAPLAVHAFLKAMLRDAWPDREVEVINLGTTAVASYPVLDMVRQILPYDIDLLVIYTGNNQYYGAYGAASRHHAGRHTWHMAATREIFRWGFPQLLASALRPKSDEGNRRLMEVMMEDSRLDPDHPAREAAPRLLREHVRTMIREARQRGVPAMVCSLAANERDLAPLGGWPSSLLGSDRLSTVTTEVAALRKTLDAEPSPALQRLDALRSRDPDCALIAYLRGRYLTLLGQTNDALRAFQEALDLDTMPWRAGSSLNRALRDAAQSEGALFCDVQAAFRARSPGGAIGWSLMDDHVHPSLEGQAELARAMVRTLREGPAELRVDEEGFARLKSNDDYAQALGANPYEAVGTAMTLASIFSTPFFRESNPEAFLRATGRVAALLSELPPELSHEFADALAVEAKLHRKQSPSALAGYLFMRQKQPQLAEPLFRFAREAQPFYSAARREYAYMVLWCRRQLKGELSVDDLAEAREEIERGQTLLTYGEDRTGKTLFFVGKLFELIGDRDQAETYLARARQMAEPNQPSAGSAAK